MLSLQPVVKMRRGDFPYAWAALDSARDWVVLSGETPDEDIALVVALLAAENADNYMPTTMSIAEAVAFLGGCEELLIDGGLLVRQGDFLIEPGCCGALPDWRGWDDLGPGALTPWMGHAPAPWVATEADGAVIHADGGAELGNVPDAVHVRVSYAEIASALAAARLDLEGFQARLESWLSLHAPENTTLAPLFRDMFVRAG